MLKKKKNLIKNLFLIKNLTYQKKCLSNKLGSKNNLDVAIKTNLKKIPNTIIKQLHQKKIQPNKLLDQKKV